MEAVNLDDQIRVSIEITMIFPGRHRDNLD